MPIILRKLSLVVLLVSILLNFQTSVLASDSSDFHLDYSTINTGASHLSSDDYIIKAGITTVETNGFSSDYNLATINKFDPGYCGDSIVQISLGEECDGANLNSKQCSDFGFNQGFLTCNACLIDTSNCSNSSAGGGGGGSHIYPPEDDDPEDDDPEDDDPEDDDPEDDDPEDDDPEDEQGSDQKDPEFVLLLPDNYNLFENKTNDYKVSQNLDYHSAADAPFYKYHLDEYTIGDKIYTDDKTPVITEILDNNTKYFVSVEDSEAKLIEQATVFSDQDGELLYELNEDLEEGLYLVKILNKDKEELQFFNIEVLDEAVINSDTGIKVLQIFEDKSPDYYYNKINDLKQIEQNKNNKISLEIIPDRHVYIYLEFEGQTIVEKLLSDENGYIEYDLSDLDLGSYTLNIVQTYNKEISSNNIIYKFNIVDQIETSQSTSTICNETKEEVQKCTCMIEHTPEAKEMLLCRYLPLIIILIILIAIIFPVKRKRRL